MSELDKKVERIIAKLIDVTGYQWLRCGSIRMRIVQLVREDCSFDEAVDIMLDEIEGGEQ